METERTDSEEIIKTSQYSKEWISQINHLNELELMIQTDSAIINIEWFRAMYSYRVPNRSWHHHTGTEIHYMVQGSVHVLFDDKSVILTQGQAIIIPSNLRHRLEESEPGTSFYKIVINYHLQPLKEDREVKLLISMMGGQLSKVIELPKNAHQLLEMLVDESISRKYGFLTVIKGNLLSVLMIVARQVSDSPNIDYSIPKKQSITDERMNNIEKYVIQNIAVHISVEDIAHHMNMSTKQVGRVIRNFCEKTPSEYVMEIKVKTAKSLLKNPEYSIGYISELLGFCNEYYFNRFFKRMEGMPPGKYRESVKAI